VTATQERVIRLVSDVLGAPAVELTLESSADTVPNWDSMAMLNLAMALEAEFAVALSPEDIADLLSVKIILSILDAKGVAGAR
jgi:acyl carrier protein